ncbi:MAG: helix-turn-helix domain-containing protein [Pseudomonadota bacterium]
MSVITWLQKRDILKRADELLRECCEHLNLEDKSLGKSSREWIARRRWSQDSKEMRRLIYHAALCSKGPVVEAHHFPPKTIQDHEAHVGAKFNEMSLEDAIGQKMSHFFEQLGPVEVSKVHKTVIEQVERPLINKCLDWSQGNQLKAARVLGINRNTLRKKMKELGIG